MSLELKLISILLFIAIIIASYFGITKSSNFKELSEEKQKIGIKKLRLGIAIGLVLGIYNILNLK